MYCAHGWARMVEPLGRVPAVRLALAGNRGLAMNPDSAPRRGSVVHVDFPSGSWSSRGAQRGGTTHAVGPVAGAGDRRGDGPSGGAAPLRHRRRPLLRGVRPARGHLHGLLQPARPAERATPGAGCRRRGASGGAVGAGSQGPDAHPPGRSLPLFDSVRDATLRGVTRLDPTDGVSGVEAFSVAVHDGAVRGIPGGSAGQAGSGGGPMASVERTITVSQPIAKVWAYLSDFTTTEEWDPPTVSTVRRSGDGGVGTTYSNVSKFLGLRDGDAVRRHRARRGPTDPARR